MENQTYDLQIKVYATDGQCYHFRQLREDDVTSTIEYLRRTKVFTAQHLALNADGALTAFPSHLVSRLDILASEPLAQICTPTWNDAFEISQEDYEVKRREIMQHMATAGPHSPRGGVMVGLHTFYLLGGFHIHIQVQPIHSADHQRPEFAESDFGSALQHSPPPAITIRRRDGGLTFLNTANIVRKTRYPGAPEGATTILMRDGEEVLNHNRGTVIHE